VNPLHSTTKDATMDTARLPYTQLAADAFRAMLNLSEVLHRSSIGRQLTALLHVRVSQLNGCAYCVDMHSRELLATGEDLQRLTSLTTWHETSLYTERERAALQWAEDLTLLPASGAPQAHFDALRPHFSDQEIAEMTFSIAQINAWNRMGVGMRLPVARKPLAPKA
jgi:AhpD family alkylhydroperoxidase